MSVELIPMHPTTSGSEGTQTYPRLTPYRIAFVLTTAGLGISKAVLVSKNDTISSTTVEWITGVIVALTFQFLDSCEHSDHRAPCLDWLFSYDCLGYSGEVTAPESNGPPEQESDVPLVVNGYRLLVSAAVGGFGLAKIICGYLGLDTAMNTLDWIIAVPLTLSIYSIGLYEDSGRSRTFRKLFDVDYSQQVASTFAAGFFLMLCATAIAYIVSFIKQPETMIHVTACGYIIGWFLIMAGSRGQLITLWNTVSMIFVWALYFFFYIPNLARRPSEELATGMNNVSDIAR